MPPRRRQMRPAVKKEPPSTRPKPKKVAKPSQPHPAGMREVKKELRKSPPAPKKVAKAKSSQPGPVGGSDDKKASLNKPAEKKRKRDAGWREVKKEIAQEANGLDDSLGKPPPPKKMRPLPLPPKLQRDEKKERIDDFARQLQELYTKTAAPFGHEAVTAPGSSAPQQEVKPSCPEEQSGEEQRCSHDPYDSYEAGSSTDLFGNSTGSSEAGAPMAASVNSRGPSPGSPSQESAPEPPPITTEESLNEAAASTQEERSPAREEVWEAVPDDAPAWTRPEEQVASPEVRRSRWSPSRTRSRSKCWRSRSRRRANRHRSRSRSWNRRRPPPAAEVWRRPGNRRDQRPRLQGLDDVLLGRERTFLEGFRPDHDADPRKLWEEHPRLRNEIEGALQDVAKDGALKRFEKYWKFRQVLRDIKSRVLSPCPRRTDCRVSCLQNGEPYDCPRCFCKVTSDSRWHCEVHKADFCVSCACPTSQREGAGTAGRQEGPRRQ